MSGMNVLKVGPDRIIGSRDMGVSEVAPGKRSCPGLRYIRFAMEHLYISIRMSIYQMFEDTQRTCRTEITKNLGIVKLHNT